MAYDPNYPADGILIEAVDFRNQFAGLKALIDAQAAQIAALQAQVNQKPSLADVNNAVSSNSAANVDGFSLPGIGISNPPTQADVQAVQMGLNQLVSSLQH
jgi:hypothetical protein